GKGGDGTDGDSGSGVVVVVELMVTVEVVLLWCRWWRSGEVAAAVEMEAGAAGVVTAVVVVAREGE
nr:hypothetical protein [Tanacetum cinerariifolium]